VISKDPPNPSDCWTGTGTSTKSWKEQKDDEEEEKEEEGPSLLRGGLGRGGLWKETMKKFESK